MVETVKEVLFKEKYETTSRREHSIEVIWYAFPKRGYWPGVALVYCLEGIIEAVVKRVFEEICDVISVPANTIETHALLWTKLEVIMAGFSGQDRGEVEYSVIFADKAW